MMLGYLESCVVPCKVCIWYKNKESTEERSLGTKNMLDHLKRCLPAPASAHNQSDSTGSASEIESTYSSSGNLLHTCTYILYIGSRTIRKF